MKMAALQIHESWSRQERVLEGSFMTFLMMLSMELQGAMWMNNCSIVIGSLSILVVFLVVVLVLVLLPLLLLVRFAFLLLVAVLFPL